MRGASFVYKTARCVCSQIFPSCGEGVASTKVSSRHSAGDNFGALRVTTGEVGSTEKSATRNVFKQENGKKGRIFFPMYLLKNSTLPIFICFICRANLS